MRFSVFVALLVATFIACTSFSSAENVANDIDLRRLRADALPVPGVENAAKNAASFVTKLKDKTALSKAVKAVQANNADEQAVRRIIQGYAAAKEGAKISDEAIAKLSASMATVVQKNPKSWPRLRKFAKYTLGATVGALAIYGAYKLLTRSNSSAVAPTTTTGSA
ncbi:Secreted RxLR effector peptide protein [Phytophthora palmivora]|uniref:Secreted RxLR effector peptide protein n=1 Tax=Phytophthora palmivora TaxID=4796 RepID=A0A2P4X2X5_9STRA|nr:Secreted RxLR effector peptide protein [Phytophthora palmivora]